MEDDVPYFGAPPDETYTVRRESAPPRRAVPQRAPYRPPKSGRGRSVLRGIVYSILITLLVYTLLSPAVLNMITNNFPGYERVFPESAEFTVERIVTIRALSGSADYTLDFPQTRDITNAQQIISMNMNPEPTQTITKYGYPWNIWDGTVGSFDNEDRITIRMTIRTETLVWNMKDSGTVLDIPQTLVDQYTGDEWRLKASDTVLDTDDRDGDGLQDIMIDPTAPQISNLAHQIADDKPDVYSKAKAIYDYMVRHFNYSTPQQMNYVQQAYGGLPKHALATLRDRWGDCDEQSMLYISFLRALGIPARMEMGFLYDESKDEWGGHAWAQIYIPSKNGTGYWYNVDIVNDEFLIRDANRFTTWVDDGNGAHLDDYYHPLRYTGLVDYSDRVVDLNYSSTGEIRVKTDENSTPGFETALFVLSTSVLIIWKRRKR